MRHKTALALKSSSAMRHAHALRHNWTPQRPTTAPLHTHGSLATCARPQPAHLRGHLHIGGCAAGLLPLPGQSSHAGSLKRPPKGQVQDALSLVMAGPIRTDPALIISDNYGSLLLRPQPNPTSRHAPFRCIWTEGLRPHPKGSRGRKGQSKKQLRPGTCLTGTIATLFGCTAAQGSPRTWCPSTTPPH